MTEVEIRRLAPSDWRLYRALRLRALADAPDAFDALVADEEHLAEAAWRERLVRRAHFAAHLDGAPVGTAGCRLDAHHGDAELIVLWVDPPARGRGIGDRLVDTVLGWAASQDAQTVRLWVATGNDAAERLYRRHGFVPTGETRDAARPAWPEREMIRR